MERDKEGKNRTVHFPFSCSVSFSLLSPKTIRSKLNKIRRPILTILLLIVLTRFLFISNLSAIKGSGSVLVYNGVKFHLSTYNTYIEFEDDWRFHQIKVNQTRVLFNTTDSESYWITLTNGSMVISDFFEESKFGFTLSGASGVSGEVIFSCGAFEEPLYVYINDEKKFEGDGWTYNATSNTVTSPFTFSSSITYVVVFENSTPTIGQFQAPNPVTSDQFFYLNTTINDADGVVDFDYAQVELTGGIKLKWSSVGNAFSLAADPNLYCVLNASGSIREAVNGTAYKLSWRIQGTFWYPTGSIDIIETNTKVVDDQGAVGYGNYTGLFTFQRGPTYTDSSTPFTIESSSAISDATWDADVGNLTFNTSGNMIVEVGTYHSPTTVEVDDVSYSKWAYNDTAQNVTIKGVYSKIELLWQTYQYTFKGPYNEDNGTISGNVTVTCISFSGEAREFELNDTNNHQYILNLTYEPYCFFFDFPINRTYYPFSSQETIYVFENASIAAVYSITLKDLTNFITVNTYLETRRAVNSTLRVIERKLIDPLEPVQVVLQEGRVYQIALKKAGEERVIGAVVADGDYEKTITITGIYINPVTQQAFKYLYWDAYREDDPTKITSVYIDNLGGTISVFFEITYMNGTQVWNTTTTEDSASVTWDQADAYTDYIVKATVNHETLGYSYTYYEKYVVAEPTSDYPFSLAALGTLPFDTRMVIPVGIVVAVAAVFSTLSAGAGLILAVVTAGILYYIGVIPQSQLPQTTIIICIALAVIFAIMLARRKEGY